MWFKDVKNWPWLLLFGSLWGVLELFGGEALYAQRVPLASVWLTAGGVFILAIGRGVLNRPGTSTAVGALAALYKLANAAPFICHLLGIFMLGLVFDVFASFLLSDKRVRGFKGNPSLTGALSAYAGNTLFAVLMTFIARYPYWVGDGLRKFWGHIFASGSLAALASVFLVPLGLWIGAGGSVYSAKRPQRAAIGASLAACAAWGAGRLFG